MPRHMLFSQEAILSNPMPDKGENDKPYQEHEEEIKFRGP